MTYPRRSKRIENHFRQEVLAHLIDRPASFLHSESPRTSHLEPKTVLAYLRAECRNDVDGRAAIRDVFANRWPRLYGALFNSEGIVLMPLAEADAAEREIAMEVYA